MTPQQLEAMKLALEALELCNGAETVEGVVIYTDKEIAAIKEALKEHAMREVQRLGQEIEQKIGCVNHDCDQCKAQPKQEPVAHSVIAGALFDFMGWLTSRKERLVLSSADEASPAVDAIRDFAKMRGLSLDDAKVQDWDTTPPQRTEQEPVATVTSETGAGITMSWWHEPALPIGTQLYTFPPQRKPLSAEQVSEICAAWTDENGNTGSFGRRQIARAIEAAHGIKGEA